ADAASLGGWSAGAVEDATTALEVLAGTLARLDPQCAEIQAAVPAAAAAVAERAEQAGAAPHGNVPSTSAAVSVELHQALSAHGIMRHRVHQLGAVGRPSTAGAAGRSRLGRRIGPDLGRRARRSPHPARGGRLRQGRADRPASVDQRPAVFPWMVCRMWRLRR
ncbi:hypothetical protein ACIRED_17305, partial [Streptomyces roseolilacinus]